MITNYLNQAPGIAPIEASYSEGPDGVPAVTLSADSYLTTSLVSTSITPMVSIVGGDSQIFTAISDFKLDKEKYVKM